MSHLIYFKHLYHIDRFYWENFTKDWSPNVGLEPTTLRLRVSCSTNWASRDDMLTVCLFLKMFSKLNTWYFKLLLNQLICHLCLHEILWFVDYYCPTLSNISLIYFSESKQQQRIMFSLKKCFRNKFTMSTTSRLAQLVEHETLNLRVVGSSPTLGDQTFSEIFSSCKMKVNTSHIKYIHLKTISFRKNYVPKVLLPIRPFFWAFYSNWKNCMWSGTVSIHLGGSYASVFVAHSH